MKNWKSVAIPGKMQALPKDKRGFPIPFIVLRDKEGEPHFTINDSVKVELCIKEKLCAICGQDMRKDMWVTGGPQSAFHENGSYIDTPVHGQCGRYAMQVCPYLSAPAYLSKKDVDSIDKGKFEVQIFVDPTMIKDRPVFFVMARIKSFRVLRPSGTQRYIVPIKPFLEVEYWKEGKQITRADAIWLAIKNKINVNM